MIRTILLILFSLIGLAIRSQTTQTVFEWSAGHDITSKSYFTPLAKHNTNVAPKNAPVYNQQTYTLKGMTNQSYTLKLHRLYNPQPNAGNSYDGFSLLYQGKNILTYYTGDPLSNCESITLEKDQAHFLKVPLDSKSFALCFGGWNFGLDDAPELIIVVVSNGKAKVVFDNYAFAYKYTPAPNFAIEYVDDISGIGEDPEIYKKPSFLKARTKHKIWREGNVLKYKSWK